MAEGPFSFLQDAFTWACKSGLIFFIGYCFRHGYLPIARPRRYISWSRVTREDLKRFFQMYTGKECDIQELANGAIYAQMISVTFPRFLNRQRIQLNPACQAERALNWSLLKMAFTMLPFDREIDPIERSRKYGKDDGFEFCKHFVAFYLKVKGFSIRNVKFKQASKNIGGYRIPRMVDDYGIGLKTESIRQPHDSDIVYTNEEREALGQKKSTTSGDEILRMFGVEDVSAVTEEMIAQWKTGQDKKTSGKEGDRREGESSMWDYNQRCLPTEFVDLNPETFLVDPMEKNLCFLPTEILTKICEKLAIQDFLNLSLSCRFLHWRMYTYCKCYAPHTLSLKIYEDEIIKTYQWYRCTPVDFFSQYNGLYGMFVSQPVKLSKPFVFELLEVDLHLPYYNNRHFGKCLPLIKPLRQRALKCVIMASYVNKGNGINYAETNEFFKEVNATSFRGSEEDFSCFPDYYTEIYNQCPYTQQMEDVLIDFGEEQIHFVPDYFPNKTGVYSKAPCASVIGTLRFIQNGSISPKYQIYLYQERPLSDDDDPKEVLRYLFSHYVFEEYFSSIFGHVWVTTVIAEDTGRRYKLRISKYTLIAPTWGYTNSYIAIGEENCFDKWDRRYKYIYDDSYWTKEICWRMETAVEGDERLWTAVEPDESEDEMTADELEEKGGDEAESKEEMND